MNAPVTDSARVDVIIVGAGLSGIGAAVHLQKHCPTLSYLILEGRQRMGGTWDLFRYPGVRSDSDMHTLGYAFKPWTNPKAIADGPSIRAYIEETAQEHAIEPHIRFGQQVTDLDWCSRDALWTITTENSVGSGQYKARFVMMCAGYYSYQRAYTPAFAGIEQFRGEVVHPQFWPEDLDYAGKQVVVIGSGATAVTLVPAMAEHAACVTMLQRSPSYMATRPARDAIANGLRRLLPARWAYAITRWKNILVQQWLYRWSRRSPEKVARLLLGEVRKALPEGYDVDTHFTPRYNPWDERLCAVPDADLFHAIRDGRARIVTDHIESFTPDGIKLTSGEQLPADIVITATGLELASLGESKLTVDGVAIDPADTFTYKGVMFSGVPNLISTFGYINASWTLRADLTAEYSCRLLNEMQRRGADIVVPELREEDQHMTPRGWVVDFTPGYFKRVMHKLPRQGDRAPWINPQNYRTDRALFRKAPLDDGVLRFRQATGAGESLVGAPGSNHVQG
ncbi:MAG: NAD(P)/FAD-dependent oxidoreductase [Halieaceae bacterium]|nr:NAD(P)/FAD-dependent oxidoreductase [Halieaceae bacterium]